MKFKKLYIQKFKKYTNQTIIFDDENNNKNNLIQHDLFKKMNITLLSGENGSGKSTILSFVSLIFRYLERYRERIPCDYSLTYEINHIDIELSNFDNLIQIKINGESSIIQNFDLKSRSYIPYTDSEIEQFKHLGLSDYNQVTYVEIQQYLPEKIHILGFDTDYNKISYNGKYVGHKIIDYRDISASYKSSDFGSNYSEGVLFIFNKSYRDNRLVTLFDTMGISFSPQVDIFLNFSEDSYQQYKENNFIERKHFTKSFWDKYIVSEGDINYCFNLKKFLLSNHNYQILTFFIQKKMIYINEFYIIKGMNIISLSGMSTGEKIFFSHLFFISSRIKDNSVLIWEEPETHLNRMWSKQLIPLLCILFSDYDFQLILSSHDTSLINSLFPNQILTLIGNSVSNPYINTFLANDVEIANNLFNTSSHFNYFEEYIISKINVLEHYKLKELLSILGDSFFKLLIYNKLNK